MPKCLACGIEKDMNKFEMYPYDNDGIITEEPIQPLFEDVPCQSNTDHSDFRVVTVCHECFHKVQPDMWMSQGEWESLNPITDFSNLLKEDAPTDNKKVA
jgi:hypothetical protein